MNKLLTPDFLDAKKPHEPYSIEQDEFLRAPYLFVHGPLVMMVVAVLLAISFALAGIWRISEGRIGVYTASFQQAETTAASGEETFSQFLARLDIATKFYQSTYRAGGITRAEYAVSQRLGLQDTNVDVVLMSAKGEVLGSTRELNAPGMSAVTLLAASSLQSGTTIKQEMPSPFGLGSVIPLLVDVSGSGPEAERLMYFLDTRQLQEMTKKIFGKAEGALLLLDSQYHTIARAATAEVDIKKIDSPGQTLLSVAAALEPSNVRVEDRVLAARAPSTRGFYVQASIREADAMQEFSTRIRATWMIVIGFGGLLVILAGLMSYALKKFSAKESYLRRLATTDILTGLPNRRSFHQLLAKATAMANKSPEHAFALFFIDLDNFKYINDSMGHSAGDALLIQAAQALQTSIRKPVQVCRLGGDEFTVIVHDLDTDAAAQAIGARILNALAEPFTIQGGEVLTKASIGVVLAPKHAEKPEDVMKFADTAMYRAKKNGKGCCVVYDETMSEQTRANATFIQRLAHAISHDEMFLAYQPKFSFKTGELTGHEALVRWSHPERGTVYPGDFIAVAEEAGLICDLGNWVLQRAVSQIKTWHEEGAGWQKVAVNVSALQIRGKDFINFVQGVLARHGVPGSCLQLELTESSIASDPVAAQAIVKELRTCGLSIAIDDFGTGYSSLSSLRQFEIDCLKVDRSFVNQIHTPEGEEICKAIIALGHALGMQIVAEGVETEAQSLALRALHCDEVQGYLYAKPMAPHLAVSASAVAAIAHGRVQPFLKAA